MFLKRSVFSLLVIILAACSPSEEELLKAAKEKLDKNSYNEAIKYLDEAILINNTNEGSFNMRGVAYFQLEDYDRAIENFNTAISLDSNNYKPYYNRGNAHLNLKDYEKALIDYNKAIDILPNNADLYINRAIVLFELKQFEASVADNQFAIKLSPGNYLPYLNNAKTYVQLGKFDQAEELLQPMAENNINIGEVYYWLAFVQINTGRNTMGCDNLIKAKNRGYQEAEEAIRKFCSSNS